MDSVIIFDTTFVRSEKIQSPAGFITFLDLDMQNQPQPNRRFLIVLVLLAVAIFLPARTVCAQDRVRLLNTQGFTNEANWTVVTGLPGGLNAKRMVLDNGIVRITYPATSDRERAGHVLYVKVRGNYVPASDPRFGDWTYVGSSFTDDVTGFEVLENSDEVVRVRLSFNNHVHTLANNLSLPVKKTIVLHRGANGYRAIVEVPSNVGGEREIGFSGSQTHLFSYSTKRALLWSLRLPPRIEDIDYMLRDEGQETGDWWSASVAFKDSFYRLISVRPDHLGGLKTGQFVGGVTGHLIHWAFQGFTSYSVFIAAVPYDGRCGRRISVLGDTATVHVPVAGQYQLYSRSVDGRNSIYLPVPGLLNLVAGTNEVKVVPNALRAPIIVPYSNGADFPEDISAQYRAGAFD